MGGKREDARYSILSPISLILTEKNRLAIPPKKNHNARNHNGLELAVKVGVMTRPGKTCTRLSFPAFSFASFSIAKVVIMFTCVRAFASE